MADKKIIVRAFGKSTFYDRSIPGFRQEKIVLGQRRCEIQDDALFSAVVSFVYIAGVK